jgi:serine/threonine protein kinase
MALAPGTRLGPYEILSPLGAGGMGAVYKPRDPRLNRPIAIKVLPGAAVADADSRERLEREAQLIAALNHSNIVTIHSAEETDGQFFLTMEFVEGRSPDEWQDGCRRRRSHARQLFEALEQGAGEVQAISGIGLAPPHIDQCLNTQTDTTRSRNRRVQILQSRSRCD